MTDKSSHILDPYGAQEGSLLKSKDPEMLRKIRDGRRRAIEDQRAMEAWASNGYISGFSGERHDLDETYLDVDRSENGRLDISDPRGSVRVRPHTDKDDDYE